MSNVTNDKNWPAQQRLVIVEKYLWWQGSVRRGDLMDRFGISQAQASSDLQHYLELNGEAITYQRSHKRYESSASMKCVLHQPRIADPVDLFLRGLPSDLTVQQKENSDDRLTEIGLVLREVPGEVQRVVMMALLGQMLVRVKILADRKKAVWQELRPAAIAICGAQWHIRAWSAERFQWNNFPLARMTAAEWPRAVIGVFPKDEEWTKWEELRLRVCQDLPPADKEQLQMDYQLSPTGEMTLSHRRGVKEILVAGLPLGFEVSPTGRKIKR